MTVVEWAEAALPLLALGWALSLVAVYAEDIAAWVARFNLWRSNGLGRPKA